VIWIGTPDNVQQGVNEAGLAYDANGLPRYDVNPHNEREHVHGDYTTYPVRIMRECATVKQVVDWVNTHQWHTFMHDQMHFADKSGDAVIISAGRDGEVVFTRKPDGDGFLVSTNFNVANPENGFGYPCWRYDRATEMLGNIRKRQDPLAIEDARDVLDAVHVENASGWTIGSMAADLTHGIVYIYFFYQYDRPLVLEVDEELRNARPAGELSLLFPEDVRIEASRRYEELQSRGERCQWFGMLWLIAVLLGLILFFIFSDNRQRKSLVWIMALIVLGPTVFILWLVFARNTQANVWRNTIQEVLGDLIPVVIVYFAVLCAMLLVTPLQGNWVLQLVVVFGLPILVSWTIFNAMLLSGKSGMGFFRFLMARLPHVIATTFISMGGITLAILPLVNLSIRECSIFPFSINTVLSFWPLMATGGMISAILLFFYEYVAVKNGFIAWTALLEKEIPIKTPSWKKLWWVILISLLVLFLGLLGGISFNNYLS
jgi:hypothetical protein